MIILISQDHRHIITLFLSILPIENTGTIPLLATIYMLIEPYCHQFFSTFLFYISLTWKRSIDNRFSVSSMYTIHLPYQWLMSNHVSCRNRYYENFNGIELCMFSPFNHLSHYFVYVLPEYYYYHHYHILCSSTRLNTYVIFVLQ